MAIKTGKEGSLQIIDATTPFAGEATTENGTSGDAYLYDIDDTDKDIWDPNTAITLSAGAFFRGYMDDGVNWFTGKVGLTTTGEGALTLSGNYVTLKTVGEISGWSYGMTIDAAENTEVGDTWKTNMPLGKSATLTLNRYRFDILFDHIADSDMILIKLFEDATTGFWVKCFRSSLGYTKAINAIDTEALTFAVSSPIAYF